MKIYRWVYKQLCWATLDEAVAPAGALPWWKKLARVVLPLPPPDYTEQTIQRLTRACAECGTMLYESQRKVDRARLLAYSWADTPFTSMDVNTMRTLSGELLRALEP